MNEVTSGRQDETVDVPVPGLPRELTPRRKRKRRLRKKQKTTEAESQPPLRVSARVSDRHVGRGWDAPRHDDQSVSWVGTLRGGRTCGTAA